MTRFFKAWCLIKKFVAVVVIFIIALCGVSACKKQELSLPTYPLDVGTMVASLRETDIAWNIAEEVSLRKFTLSADNGQIGATVTSAIMNEERFLLVQFLPYLAEEEWENAIVLATILFGGAESKHQIYDHFINEYDTKNSIKKKHELISEETGYSWPIGDRETTTWHKEIDGISYKIVSEQRDMNAPKRYLLEIRITTDAEAFLASSRTIYAPTN